MERNKEEGLAPFTLPTGTISMSQVATELGISQTGINLNDSRVRTLAGVGGSGTPISMDDLRGKSSSLKATVVCGMGANMYYGYKQGEFGTCNNSDLIQITAEDFWGEGEYRILVLDISYVGKTLEVTIDGKYSDTFFMREFDGKAKDENEERSFDWLGALSPNKTVAIEIKEV